MSRCTCKARGCPECGGGPCERDATLFVRTAGPKGEPLELPLCSGCAARPERMGWKPEPLPRETDIPPMPPGARLYAYGHDGQPYDSDAPKGLGRWERNGKQPCRWVYVTPQGLRIGVIFTKDDSPPPLPRPRAEWARCGCREGPHDCGACGQPYWVELHGVADGYCTYCYHNG